MRPDDSFQVLGHLRFFLSFSDSQDDHVDLRSNDGAESCFGDDDENIVVSPGNMDI